MTDSSLNISRSEWSSLMVKVQLKTAVGTADKTILDPSADGVIKESDKTSSENASTAYHVNLSSKAEKSSGQGEGSGSILDVAIEKIKAQIEAIKQQMKALENKEGAEVEAQRKALQQQLTTLTAALMDLMNSKTNMET